MKKLMGRRKIEMEMVEDAGSRQVTFSKRRNGLFKKANELAILCGAELAVVVFSPGGKPFSFGHPSVDAVARRFQGLDGEPKPEEPSQKGEKLNKRLEKLTKRLKAEKQRGEMLDKAITQKKEEMCGLGLGPEPGPEDLDGLKKWLSRLEKLQEDVKARKREMEAASSLIMLAGEPEKKKKNAGKRIASC